MDTSTITLSTSSYIITAIVSAGIAALLSGVFQIICKAIDNKQKIMEKEYESKESYLEGKKQAYISTLERLQFLRRGFSITKEQLRVSDKIQRDYFASLDNYHEKEAILRLYSPDEIYSTFKALETRMKQYAYAESECWRLTEEGKLQYDIAISLLSKLMQADLGFRTFDKSPEMIICPDCSYEHDIVSTCKCGMTFEQLQRKITESIVIEQEMTNTEQKVN